MFRSTSFLFCFIVGVCSVLAHDGSHDTVYEGFNDVQVMPMARSDMSATLVDGTAFEDGHSRIYLVGGCSNDQLCPPGEWCFCPEITDECDYFNPETQDWFSCSVAPRARSRHAAVTLMNKLFVLGGRDINDELITEVDVYDPTTDSWTTPFSWPAATSDLGVFVDNDDIYMVGGWSADYTPVDSLVKLSTSNGDAPYSLTEMPPMLGGGRGDVGVASVPLDPLDLSQGYAHYVIGGFEWDICVPLASVEVYDVATSTWLLRDDLALGRGDLALGVIDGLLFAVAGETKDDSCDSVNFLPGQSIPVGDVERFDPTGHGGESTLAPQYDSDDDAHALGKWFVEEEVPAGRFRFIAASYKDQILLFGGQGDFDEVNHIYPVLNTTMLYVPATIVRNRNDLKAGEIAGISVAVIAVVAGLVVAAVARVSYRKYWGYAPPSSGDDDTTPPNATDDCCNNGSAVVVDMGSDIRDNNQKIMDDVSTSSAAAVADHSTSSASAPTADGGVMLSELGLDYAGGDSAL